MADESTTQNQGGKPAGNRTFNCPNCGAGLHSPYHTICPVCAEPIDSDTIQNALGARIELAGGGTAQMNVNGLMLGALIAGDVAILAFALFMLNKG